MSTVLPILQDTTIVAAGPRVQNVSLSGAVPVGIVGDAGQWVKTGPRPISAKHPRRAWCSCTFTD